MFGAAWLTSVLAEREKLEGRPCRSFAPGARTIKLCSLDGRSWTNTGTLPRDIGTRRQQDARSGGSARPPELVTCASWGRVKAGGTRHGLHRLWVEPR